MSNAVFIVAILNMVQGGKLLMLCLSQYADYVKQEGGKDGEVRYVQTRGGGKS